MNWNAAQKKSNEELCWVKKVRVMSKLRRSLREKKVCLTFVKDWEFDGIENIFQAYLKNGIRTELMAKFRLLRYFQLNQTFWLPSKVQEKLMEVWKSMDV